MRLIMQALKEGMGKVVMALVGVGVLRAVRRRVKCSPATKVH